MKLTLLTLTLLLSILTCNAQNIKIRGVVEHPISNSITLIKVDNDLYSKKPDTPIKILLSSSGEFNANLKVTQTDNWIVEHGNKVSRIDLQPGNDLQITFTEFNYHQGYTVKGDRINDVKFMSALESDKFINDNYNQDYVNKIIQTKDLNENLQLRKRRSVAFINFLNEYNKHNPLSKSYYTWKKNELMYEPYLQFLTENFSSKELATAANLFGDIEKTQLDNDSAAISSSKYLEFLDLYSVFKSSNGDFMKSRMSDCFNYGVKNFKGLTKEVFLTRQMVNMVYIDSIYNKYNIIYLDEVRNPNLISIVKTERNKVLEAKKLSQAVYKSLGLYKNLASIFEKYRGNLIYVDFWASWCVPCRQEMPSSKQLREKLKDKKIVFLYLGYNDQPTNWLIARKELNIQGEHLLLNKDLMDEARKAFNINGIPHYAIINEKGEISEQIAGRPSEERTEEILKKYLEKK